MTLVLTSRETIRDKVFDLASADLQADPTTTSKPIFVVFKYQPDTEELDGKSPYMFISSGPAKRGAQSLPEKRRGEIMLLIGTGIRVDGENLSEAQIEDRLDLIEKKLNEMLLSATNIALTGFWQWVELEGTSFVGYERKGNNIYRVEAWNYMFRVSD